LGEEVRDAACAGSAFPSLLFHFIKRNESSQVT
jgi:hypothetical protein